MTIMMIAVEWEMEYIKFTTHGIRMDGGTCM